MEEKKEMMKGVKIDPNKITVDLSLPDKVIRDRLENPKRYFWISDEIWEKIIEENEKAL